jgi:hypothetical protein
MNYRRGLFRLWVILTVLWIGGVAFVTGPDVYRDFDLAALKAAVPVSLAHAASEESVIRRCLIEIDGRVYLNRPCVVTTRNGLVTLGVSDTRPAKYFAYGPA